MKLRQHGLVLALGVLSVLTTGTARSDMFNYGSYSGYNTEFSDVTEITAVPCLLPYGAPTVSGDQLNFDMFQFQRQADAAPGGPFPVTSFLNGQLSFSASADPGWELVSVTISAGGSYSAFGPDAFARANLNANVKPPGSIAFDSGSTTFQSSPTSGFDVTDGSWSGNMTILFDPTSQVEFDLDTRLLAFAGTSNFGTSFINAEFLTISFSTRLVSVPEPSGAVLAISAAGILLAFHRKRRRQSGKRERFDFAKA